MKHRSVRCAPASEMMPLNKPSEAPAFAGSDDVDQFVRIENIDHHLVAGIRRFVALNGYFTNETRRRGIRLFEMAGHWFVHALRFDELDKPELHRVISIVLSRLLLNNDARPGLNHGYRHNRSVVLQQLSHADFLAQ